jgi:transcriptional regulator with XRE-family HTH domain
MKSKKEQQKISARIKKIRKEAGLRQWELARFLGTTQSAIHKYEHGVTPEPRRLLKLAKIGNTTIEWILTGRHWENGFTGKERIQPDILDLAHAFKCVSNEKRKAYLEAIDLLEESMKVLETSLKAPPINLEPEEIARALKGFSPEVLEVLSAAAAIQKAIQNKIVSTQKTRLIKVKSRKES